LKAAPFCISPGSQIGTSRSYSGTNSCYVVRFVVVRSREQKAHLHDPTRDGVSTFFRCEAPSWSCHGYGGIIMPSIPLQEPRAGRRLRASSQAVPLIRLPALCGCEASMQPDALRVTSRSPGSHGLWRRHRRAPARQHHLQKHG